MHGSRQNRATAMLHWLERLACGSLMLLCHIFEVTPQQVERKRPRPHRRRQRPDVLEA